MESYLVAVFLTGMTTFVFIFTDLRSWIRNTFKKRVECWFCRSTFSVKYSDGNSWTCSNCMQYNGFNKDGGYNRVIEEQYEERLNISNAARRNSSKVRNSQWSSNGARLCRDCNYNQELKIKQLASYVPMKECDYDREIEHYRQQLDKSYKLCNKCETYVANVLDQIASSSSSMGPRRLPSSVKKIKRWLSMYISLLISIWTFLNLYLNFDPLDVIKLIFNIPIPISGGSLGMGLGPLSAISDIITARAKVWSFIHIFLWLTLVAAPYWVPTMDTHHIAVIQLCLAGTLMISMLIIVTRRLYYEHKLLKRHGEREKKRFQHDVRVWSIPKFKSNESELAEEIRLQKKSEIYSAQRNKKRSEPLLRPSVVRPIPRKSLHQNLNDLSIGTMNSVRDKSSHNPFYSFEGSPLTRSSSYSSGISLSPPASPKLWSTPVGWSSPCTANNGSSFSNVSRTQNFKRNHFKRADDEEVIWNTNNRSFFNSNNEVNHREYSPKTASYQTACSVYPTYPVAYYYSEPSKTPQTNSNSSSLLSSFLSALPTVILALSNVALVYFICIKSN